MQRPARSAGIAGRAGVPATAGSDSVPRGVFPPDLQDEAMTGLGTTRRPGCVPRRRRGIRGAVEIDSERMQGVARYWLGFDAELKNRLEQEASPRNAPRRSLRSRRSSPCSASAPEQALQSVRQFRRRTRGSFVSQDATDAGQLHGRPAQKFRRRQRTSSSIHREP